MINLDIKEGYLCEHAGFFLTRSGRPKVTFRLGVPRDKSRPRKQFPPAGIDFVTVVAYGHRFAHLFPELPGRRHVLVVGFTQSRDLTDGRVVTELVAERISVFDEFRPVEAQEWDAGRMEIDDHYDGYTGEDNDIGFCGHCDDSDGDDDSWRVWQPG